MKKFTSFLMVLLVTLGAMAQAEATVTLVHTASSYSGATAGAFTSTVDAAKEHINLSKFSGTWAGAAYAEFSIEMPEGNYSIKSASLAWSAVGPNKKTGYTTDVMYVTAGSYLNYEEMALGSAKVDLGATYIATVSIAPWAAVTDFTTDVSGAVKEIVESGQNYIIFKFTNNPGGGDLYGKGATEKNPVLTIELADANSMTTYTVKYVDESGAEIKEASVYDILTGENASISDENKVAIYKEDKKYIYVSCDKESITTVADGASNVITATFREAATWNYTVNAVDGDDNVLKVLATGSNFEGETVTIPYNQYILKDSALYAAFANSQQYNKFITLSADDMVVPVVYNADTIDNVIYFSEAENIEGMTATTSGNANIRCSNGTGAYNGSDDPVVVTTLTPGIYTIAAQVWGNAGVHFNIVCGGDTLVVSTTGSITTGSKEFVVNEESQVTILRAGDRNKSIDWIYIQEKDPALTTYTVKYVDEADNELKEASVYDILPGEKAFIKDENMVAILKGDKKYAYKSCDKDTIVAVPSAELNVITATFRELAKYSYTVDAVDEAGNELKVIADTSDFEGTVTVPYNQYILVDDVLYVASADNQQYNKYVTLASDTAMSIVYKESSIDNIVYFSEAEDIEGMTATTSGYANVRCSDGTGAYNASDDPVVVTTLAPGAYTIAAQVWGNAGVHFNIVCGGDTLVVSTTGSITKGSKEFVVNEESQVEILKAGDRNKSNDWIYIQNRELIIADNGSDLNAVGPYSSVSYTRDIAADTYATICLPFAPDAASLENYSFYTLESVDEGILNFVEETAPVANTPYIYCLKEGKTATAITGGITVVSNELNDVVVGDWTMKGSFTNQSFDTSAADVKYYGYVSGENIVVKSDDTFAVEPYRAYFTSSVDVADMYLRIISSDDEATEITTADLDVQKPVVIYDLAGRRVEKMDKGIYIVNGKKVVK